jgi:hypothetical protein
VPVRVSFAAMSSRPSASRSRVSTLTPMSSPGARGPTRISRASSGGRGGAEPSGDPPNRAMATQRDAGGFVTAPH